MTNIEIDIPDEVLVRRFGSMPWVTSEDRVIPVVRHLDNHGHPIIKYHAFRNLDRQGLSFPFRREYQIRFLPEMRCFYTGSLLYLTTETLISDNWRHAPWAATREHVASRRGNDLTKVNVQSNLVPCSKMINRMVTHVPLVVKLFWRDRLSEIEFDRDEMSSSTALMIRDVIIEKIQQLFWFHGNFPWWRHAYIDATVRPAIDEFCRILRQYEDDFLNQNANRQREILKNPLEIGFPDIAYRLLGVGK